MIRRPRLRGAVPAFRLTDGLLVAAIALLGLKVLGLFATASRTVDADPLPSFGRVIAHARSNQVPDDPQTTGSVSVPKEEPPAPVSPAPSVKEPAPPLVPPSGTERALLERLGERRDELQQRARDAEAREKLLQDQERRLDERVAAIKASETGQKSAAAARASEADAAAMKSVVTMYENMKPKDAARVFERLPADVLIAVVQPMNARKMSEILAAMSPDSAEKLTVALAARARGPAGAKPAESQLPPGELPAIELPAIRR